MNKMAFLTGCMILISLGFLSAISITEVHTNPQEVSPGKVFEISIKIKNIFNQDFYNVNVKLNLSEREIPFAPYQSSSEEFVEGLDEGDKETFTFNLITLPTTASGIYKIPVIITFSDEDGNSWMKSELISITVNSEPELKAQTENSDVLIKGRENSLSIRVINSGLADVKFVYMLVNETQNIRFISEREQYIGDIDSDDFDNAEYRIYIEENSASIINLPILIRFRDATNKEFTAIENLQLKIYSQKEAQNLGLLKKPNYGVYCILAFLILLYLGNKYRKHRKKLKNKPG